MTMVNSTNALRVLVGTNKTILDSQIWIDRPKLIEKNDMGKEKRKNREFFLKILAIFEMVQCWLSYCIFFTLVITDSNAYCCSCTAFS